MRIRADAGSASSKLPGADQAAHILGEICGAPHGDIRGPEVRIGTHSKLIRDICHQTIFLEALSFVRDNPS
jgi:hypothetical protein